MTRICFVSYVSTGSYIVGCFPVVSFSSTDSFSFLPPIVPLSSLALTAGEILFHEKPPSDPTYSTQPRLEGSKATLAIFHAKIHLIKLGPPKRRPLAKKRKKKEMLGGDEILCINVTNSSKNGVLVTKNWQRSTPLMLLSRLSRGEIPNRPPRARYVYSDTSAKRKVRNLLPCHALSPDAV